MQRNYSDLVLVALATVGVTEIIKNLIQKGGRRIWTAVTMVVGSVIVIAAVFLPEQVLYGIVGVSGATVFYDTIYKSFSRMFRNMTIKEGQ